MRLLVDADLDPALPAALGVLRNVQAWSVVEHGLRRAEDEVIMAFATQRRMLLVTNDAGISARRFPICTHPGIIVLHVIWLDPAAVVGRLRLLWRSGLRSRLPHCITTIDDQGVKIVGPGLAQHTPAVFLVRPNWLVRGARLEPAAGTT